MANVPQQSRKGCVLLYDEHADDKWDEFSRRCEREAEFHLGAAPGADSDAGETEAERAVRVARELTVGAPPYREQAKYGPLGDAAGNDLFRADRCGMSASRAAQLLRPHSQNRMSFAMLLHGGSARTAMAGHGVRL